MIDPTYCTPIKAPYSITGLRCEWCNEAIQRDEEVVVWPSLRILHVTCMQEWEMDEGELGDDF